MNPLDTFYFNWAKVGMLCNEGMASTEALAYATTTGDTALDLVFTHIQTSFDNRNFDNTFTYLDELQATYPELIILSFYIQLSLTAYTGSFMTLEHAAVIYGIVKKVKKEGSVSAEIKQYLQGCLSLVNPNHPILSYLQTIHTDLKPATDENNQTEVPKEKVFSLSEQYELSPYMQLELEKIKPVIDEAESLEQLATKLGWYEQMLS